jgi:predicted TIM-barrel enzyme
LFSSDEDFFLEKKAITVTAINVITTAFNVMNIHPVSVGIYVLINEVIASFHASAATKPKADMMRVFNSLLNTVTSFLTFATTFDFIEYNIQFQKIKSFQEIEEGQFSAPHNECYVKKEE